MASLQEKLADSLAVLKEFQDKNENLIIKGFGRQNSEFHEEDRPRHTF